MTQQGFVGRERELAMLQQRLGAVGSARGDNGKAVLLRGRRRVGKSRLITEFIKRSGVPSLYFQASRYADQQDQLRALMEALATSDLPGAPLGESAAPTTLTAAFRLIAAALPDSPAIVVIDEAPWLLEEIKGGAGELQRVWDKDLSQNPVLLLLLGSDLTMMQELNNPDQPFYGRGREMLLKELNPAEIATWTGLSGIRAFDAYLLTGGQPLIAEDWQLLMTPNEFIKKSLSSPVSALATEGVRVLDSEFPASLNARDVLTAIGGRGERTYTGILTSLSGRMTAPTLEKSLALLADKGVIAADEPLSTRRSSRDKRWRVSDPALRFWLAFMEPSLGDIDRGRADLAIARFNKGYQAWRGRAIEPVIREALNRLLPDDDWLNIREVGGWWPRTNIPEIDIVGADGRPAHNISFVGTIKWRERAAITDHDVAALAKAAVSVPGVTPLTPLVGISAHKSTAKGLTQSWSADDLLAAWG